MLLHLLDWLILASFFLILLAIGFRASRTAGKSHEEYFLSGRSMPWWLLGVSMVATTFSADTPNLVTGMVREDGVAKNWAWWSFLITGMVTVFIYARLWRRSNCLTDLEFYELRYSGRAASFLRGARAVYLGVFFNCLIMGAVTLAAIKIGSVMFGLEPWVIVVGGSVVIGLYSAIGGIKGVIWTDFFQFGIAMVGAVYAAHVAVSQPEIGSLKALFSHPGVQEKMNLIPSLSDPSLLITLFLIPIAVQWWSVWYPGAEPGGGGYIAQRMLASKSEEHALGATLLFNVAHYALRPWPWIIVALCSVILYPDLASIREVFPAISDQYLGEDIAYPVMLTYLSPGWLGLVTASLIAAYMSTISTHLNWGSSYLVLDVYHRFIRRDASENELVQVGRIATVLLMALSGAFALLFLENATQAFNIVLLSGAGTGAIFLLRWFWWRLNAVTELVAMLFGAALAVVLVLVVPDEAMATALIDGFTMKLLTAVVLTSIVWIATVMVTKPESYETLRRFYETVKPGGPGWGWLHEQAALEGRPLPDAPGPSLPGSMLMVLVGSIGIYSAMLGTGNLLYGRWTAGVVLLLTTLVASWLIHRHLTQSRRHG